MQYFAASVPVICMVCQQPLQWRGQLPHKSYTRSDNDNVGGDEQLGSSPMPKEGISLDALEPA